MAKITIESQKIDDIRIQLEKLVQDGQRVESDADKRHIQQRIEPLDKIELDIQEYVKNNPGTPIQGVVDNVNYARVTVYRAIKRLVKYGIINVELDKRKHRLYVSNDSLIVSVNHDIKKFKKSYFNLIKTSARVYKGMVARSDPKYVSIMGNYLLCSQTISNNLITILKHFITSYSLYAVFEWPKTIKDAEGLNRLYLTVFQSFNEIFSELSNYIPFHLREKNEKIQYLNRDLMTLYGEFETYENIAIEFHRYDLDMEFDLVISDLFRASKMPREWSEIRTAMEEQ
jgi:DNA-binding Lrp family transcriptional regulator